MHNKAGKGYFLRKKKTLKLNSAVKDYKSKYLNNL